MEHTSFRGPDGQQFTRYNEEKMSWKAARAFCKSLGGRMAILDTQVLNDLVHGELPLARLWLGASDEQQEGSWRWINGETMDGKYQNWGSGKPDVDRSKNCLLMQKGHWQDYPCKKPGWPLCEQSLKRVCTIKN